MPPIHYRTLFLSSLGAIQLITHWSYYVQFPGLLSASGIEPVERIFPRAAPELYEQLIHTNIMDVDSLCELLSVLGMLISVLIVTQICQNALLFGFNLMIYGLLVKTGGTFYSFQWDVLLLETTFVTAVTYAPWTRLRPNNQDSSPTAPIPLRFLLFKLMLMSGIVKLQAQCPTWEQLTALEFHFATQCLPGPLACHDLWMEIPATVLLIVPFREARRIGAVLQVLLQVLIILTGNYNFFNLLTLVLCIPVWEHPKGSGWKALTRGWQKILTWGFLLWTFFFMFVIQKANDDGHWNITLNQNSVWLEPRIYLPYVPYGTLLVVTVTSFSTKSITKIFHGLVCLWIIGILMLPFNQIYPRKHFLRPRLTKFQRALPPGLVNGYGLFRRMTGVGRASRHGGWAGVPPSVVARPEIVMEGVYEHASEDDWQELEIFPWKPGNVHNMPAQMAPHQPRLDWQMWFAALGTYHHNPWLLHLISKVLTGCEPVLDLVGATDLPKLQRIRAKLYHYDFTRLNTTWARTIPGVELVEGPSPVWTRTLANEYLPPVEARDLSDYLNRQLYKPDYCVDPKQPCAHRHAIWCPVLNAIRQFKLYLGIPLGVVVWLLLVWAKKESPKKKGQPVKNKQSLEEKKKQ